MKKFLCFFVGAASFAGTFSVPYTLEYYVQGSEEHGIARTMQMEDPAAVGLQACKLRINKHVGTIFAKNLKGDRLSCDVIWPVVELRSWIFSAGCSGEDAGEVWFLMNDELGQHLDVSSAVSEDQIKYELGAVNLWTSLKRLRYVFGKDGVTVWRFFGCDESGEDVFVSATIAYNNLKRVEIGCGKGDSEKRIGALSVAGVCRD